MAIIPKLALIPSGYKAGTLYSVLPTNGDGDFTTSRSSSATRVNKSGLIETVLSNVPRLDYSDGSCPSLLLEPQSTNLFQYSEDFSQSYWVRTGSYNIVYENKLNPKGELGYYKLTGSGQLRTNPISVGTSVNDFTLSILVKNIDSDSIRLGVSDTSSGDAKIDFFFATETFGTPVNGGAWTNAKGSFIKLKNGWYYVSLTATKNAGGSVISKIIYENDSVALFAAQVEQQSYPTSYIPTNGSAVTRNADLAKKGGLSNSIGQVEGTVFLDFEYLLEIGTNSSNDALRDIFAVGSDFNTANIISVDNYRSQFRIFITANGVTSSIGLGGFGTAQANTRYKLAFRYKSGDSKAFLNGVQMGSSTNSVNFTNTIDSVFFSYNNSSNSFKNQKKVNGLQIFTEALTDAELQTLTTI